jgi:hypothetical protein
MKQFEDIHKNKLCFIYGAGPSLHSIDCKPLEKYITFAVNSGVVKAKWCDYFLSDDIGMTNWSYYTELLPTLDCKKLLYKEKLAHHRSHLDNVFLFDHTWWFSPSNRRYNYDGLTLNKTGPIVGARTSMGSAVHFAYIMGCNPIVLLGNDCRLKDDKRYFWQYPGEDAPHRVDGRRFTSRTQNWGFSQSEFIEYWTCFAQMNKNILEKGIEIIDCSDSVLDCFPKMKIEKILEKYGDKYESNRIV